MNRVVIGVGLAALLLLKLDVQNPANFTRAETRVQIGLPWLWPIDSGQARCIRVAESTLTNCIFMETMARYAGSATLATFGACLPCYDFSIWSSKIGRDRYTSDNILRRVNAWQKDLNEGT